MANINATFNGTLTAVDAVSGSTLVSRALSLLFQATTIFYEPYFQASTGGSTVNLPAPTVNAVVVVNTGLNELTVTFTPAGFAATSITLLPGDSFVYFQIGNSAGGITALSLTATGSTQPAEVFVAA